MISLNEYIEQNSVKSVIEAQLLKHIYIEFHNEEYAKFLLEGHSLFPGCDEIVNFIIVNLEQKISENNRRLFKKKNLTIEFTDFKNNKINENSGLAESLVLLCSINNDISVFFDKLILDIDFINTDTINAAYIPKELNFNSKTYKLKECIINLDLPKGIQFNEYVSYVKKSLVHELTHAYEDYNRSTKEGIDTLYDILSKVNYTKAINNIRGESGITKFVSQYFYCINKQEQNAYLAEFNEILSQNAEKINNSSNKVNQALMIIKQSTIWKKYNEVYEIVQLLKTNKLDNIKPQIANSYKELDKTFKRKTDESIIRYMIINWDKFQHTFNKKLSKIIYNYITNYDTK